jgi:hypothetical protein
MFEHRTEPLLQRRQFAWRVAKFSAIAVGLFFISLDIGVAGYVLVEGMPWHDALLNVSMLLGGMGPVHPPTTVAGKVFASLFALYSGLLFVVAAGIMMAPMLHRLLHHMHLEKSD